MELITRECISCGKVFFIDNETDYVCDACIGEMYTPHHLSKEELYGRDWENKEIKRQWQETSKESLTRLDAKYTNKKELGHYEKPMGDDNFNSIIGKIFVV